MPEPIQLWHHNSVILSWGILLLHVLHNAGGNLITSAEYLSTSRGFGKYYIPHVRPTDGKQSGT